MTTHPAVTVEPSAPFYDRRVGRTVTPHTVTRDGNVIGFVTDTDPRCTCNVCQVARFIVSVPTDGTVSDTRELGRFGGYAAAVSAVLSHRPIPAPVHPPRHTVTIDRRYTVTVVGTIDAYVTMADDLTPGGLDSMDAGDATGAFLDLAAAAWAYPIGTTQRPWFATQNNSHGDVSVTVDYDDALYVWSPADL